MPTSLLLLLAPFGCQADGPAATSWVPEAGLP